MEIQFDWALNGRRYPEIFKLYSSHVLTEKFGFTLDEDIDSNDDSRNHFNDPNTYGEVMLSDFIMEISSTFSMQKYITDNEKKYSVTNAKVGIDEILNYNLQVQILIDIVKVDLSILFNGNLNTYNYSFEENIVRIIALIEDLKDNFSILNLSEKTNIIDEIEAVNINLSNTDFADIYTRTLDRLLYIIHTENLNSYDVSKRWRAIFYDLKKVPESLGGEHSLRYDQINLFTRHLKLERKVNSISRLKMGLSQSFFESKRKVLVQRMVDRIQEIQSYTVTYDEYVDDFFSSENKLIKLKNFFKNRENITDEIGNELVSNEIIDYYSKDKGCFGILETNKGCYYSFSGPYDYTGSKYLKGFNPHIEALAIQINKDLFDSKYEWATLSDSTCRYINYDCDRDLKNLKHLNSPIELGRDTEISTPDKIGFHYSCCERKMQAVCDDWSIDKIYYSRWAPCEKCAPSFFYEKGKVEVYALAPNFSKWSERTQLNKKNKLKQYELKSSFLPKT